MTGSVYAIACATLLLLFKAVTIPHEVFASAWSGRRLAWLGGTGRGQTP